MNHKMPKRFHKISEGTVGLFPYQLPHPQGVGFATQSGDNWLIDRTFGYVPEDPM